MPALLTATTKQLLKETVDPKERVKAGAIAKLYRTDGQSGVWEDIDIYGVVAFTKQPSTGCLYLAIYYCKPRFDKKYTMERDDFYWFESDDCLFGLSFGDKEEAKAFHAAVIRKCAKELRENRSSGLLSGLFGMKKSKERVENNEKKRISVDDMSEPRNFQHLQHLGYNPLTGSWEPKNIPPEWMAMFEKAGVREDELRNNREVAGRVARFVSDNMEVDDVGNGKGKELLSAVPLIPKKTAPPPPPPLVSSNKPVASPKPAKAPAPSTKNAPPPPPPPTLPAKSSHSQLQPQQQEKTEAIPSVPSDRADLLASIRNVGGIGALRPAPKQPVKESSASPVGKNGKPGDLMASMLAKALAERNQPIAKDDSDDDY